MHRETDGWTSVRLARHRAVEHVDVFIGDPAALPVTGDDRRFRDLEFSSELSKALGELPGSL